MARLIKSTMSCSRCQKPYSNRLPKIIEFIFTYSQDDDDNISSPAPVIVDMSGKDIRLCTRCIVEGGGTEIMNVIRKKIGIPTPDLRVKGTIIWKTKF